MISFATEITWLNVILFILGIAILIKGSDIFVESASALAKKLGVSDIVIGLTLVSLGTSMPELAANLIAAINKAPVIALGNVIGSNFTNVTLILGTACILIPKMAVPSSVFKRDIFFMLIGSCSLVVLLFIFKFINFYAGVSFLILTGIYTYILVKQDSQEILAEEEQINKDKNLWSILLLFPVGLIMIFVGSKTVVDNTIWASVKLGINQGIIATTVVALGTSLPELAVTISGIIKKKNAIALGNVIGSNIYNILLIIGISCCITKIPLNSGMGINLIFLLISDILLMLFLVIQRKLTRLNGIIFLLLYIIFITVNIVNLKA